MGAIAYTSWWLQCLSDRGAAVGAGVRKVSAIVSVERGQTRSKAEGKIKE
jgi:hypothetical protein